MGRKKSMRKRMLKLQITPLKFPVNHDKKCKRGRGLMIYATDDVKVSSLSLNRTLFSRGVSRGREIILDGHKK